MFGHPLSVWAHWDIYTVVKSLKSITISIADGKAAANGELVLSQFRQFFFLLWINILDSSSSLDFQYW